MSALSPLSRETTVLPAGALWLLPVVLLVIDIRLIQLDLAWAAGAMVDALPGRPYVIQINQDFSLAEMFNFAKWMLAAGLLFATGGQRPVWAPAGWAMILMLCDDALMLHERSARLARDHLSETFGSVTGILGEMALILVLAIAVFSLLFLSRRRAAPQDRPQATALIVLMVLLGVFGVGVDLIHNVLGRLYDSHLLHSLMAIAENGGEMIVTSLIAVQALRIRVTSARAAPV